MFFYHFLYILCIGRRSAQVGLVGFVQKYHINECCHFYYLLINHDRRSLLI